MAAGTITKVLRLLTRRYLVVNMARCGTVGNLGAAVLNCLCEDSAWVLGTLGTRLLPH